MILKVLRDEKLISGIKEFVKKALGERFIESPPFDLIGAFNDSQNTTPIIFVLSPGADPITYLIGLAKSKGMDQRLKILSLGQGQGRIAEKLIEGGHRAGDWVCLQNCHLSASWMPELEKIQERQDENTMNPEYRLWLTSMPSRNFPVPVLQSGIKITNEPPKGLKANLKGTFNEVTPEEYESCTKPKEYKKLLFALAYFHAVILERRKYGAIGWNIPYEWMNSDFVTSKTQLKMYLDEQPDIPYTALNYIVAEVNYGGRVTDDKDVRSIKALLKRYFCAELMNDNYKLSKIEHYYAPPESDVGAVKAYINQLPLEDDPEVFGLHPNANITFEQKIVREFMETILLIQPRISGGKAVKSTEEIVQDMARDIVSKVPKVMDKRRAHPLTFEATPEG
jgi:dynein heavy chain